ncbi:MAG: DUF1684 domain-containing protein [Chloroflexales bacterium]|nr:DUF1684 domain-containing protein [Chloroflexales bacterium]
MANPTNPLTLAHWRRSVAEIYSAVRWTPLGKQPRIWKQFRAVRDDLFANHPDSPLSTEQRAQFTGLNYYPYDPSWRVLGDVEPAVERDTFAVDLPVDGPLHYMRVAWICFMLQGQAATLSLFWIEGYGGGLFLPFGDATGGETTYGGGRYLYDTIKGADLGSVGGQLVLDFNYAYNPSCAYNDRWVCPLTPRENRLPWSVEAGEQTPTLEC